MLINVKSTLRVGDTLVPMIFLSDRTHLSNVAGDENEWSVIMTFGNLSSKICQMPSTHSVVMVALLPIPINNRNIPQNLLDEQRQSSREVLNAVLQWELQPLTCKQTPSAKSRYYNVLCADGNFRHCKLVSAAWFAECPEDSDLRHLLRHVCFRCKCPKNELGDYVPPDKQHPRRDHNLYWTLSDANTKATNPELLLRYVQWGFNVSLYNPCVRSDLPKPDLLHTIQIGMLDHLQQSIFPFMRTNEQLDKYNAIWLCIPAYHLLTPKNESYEDVSQWNGKEI